VNWYDYIACFFARTFLANVVPHFVHGISGDRFPTPFAHTSGKGLSRMPNGTPSQTTAHVYGVSPSTGSTLSPQMT